MNGRWHLVEWLGLAAPPPELSFEDPSFKRIVRIAAWAMLLAGLAIGGLLVFDPAATRLQVGLNLLIGLDGALVLCLAARGRQRLACHLMIWGFFVAVTLISANNGGMRSPNLLNYPVMIVVCAWVLGARATLTLSALIWLVFMLFLLGDAQGWMPPAKQDHRIAYLVLYSAMAVVTAAATLISRHHYLRRLAEARRLADSLATSEDELRRHRDCLEELVVERTQELSAARAEAERLLRVKSEFLAHMSHEIRTPLNGMLGIAQVGLRRSADMPEMRARFARLLDAGRLLQGVIDDILDFSKIEAGKLEIEHIPFALRRVIDDALALVTERAVEKGLALRAQIADDCPPGFLGDPLRLTQILMNLLSNAVKFTPSGEIVLAARREDGQLVLSVHDTGIGMRPEQLQRIFAPFEQADGSTTREYGGSGLGLSITRRLCELMEGSIAVESEPGQGSCFTVRLPCPVATLPETAELVAAALSGSRLRGLHVLVVDDQELNRMVLEDMLSAEGAVVEEAADGQAAIDCVDRRGAGYFGVVLMDVQMPVMDGYVAAAHLHAHHPQLPIIGQTANVLEEDRQRCLAAGMVDAMAKPIDAETLINRLQSYVVNRP